MCSTSIYADCYFFPAIFLRLICAPTGHERHIEEPWREERTQVVFQDGYPQLVCFLPSLASPIICAAISLCGGVCEA